MKSIHITRMMQRVAALMLLFVGSITAAQADTKLYVEDFTVNSGEEKKVAVCLDTDLSDICHVGFTINLPAGLSFVHDGERIKMNIEASRAGAGMSAESAWSNGKVIFSDLMRQTAISAGTGAICYFYVQESGLTGAQQITLSNVQLKRQDKSTVSDVVTASGTVSKNGAVASGIDLQFGETTVEFTPGETKTITVSMDNTGKEVQAFQSKLVIPTGWTAAVSSSRGTFDYKPETGTILNQTGVTGSFGTLLNIALTAPSTFAGSAQIQLTGTKMTVNWASVALDDITMTVTSSQAVATKPTVAFGAESVVIVPNKSGNIDVNMNNGGITVQGFQATLELPTGWIATKTDKRGTFDYRPETGRILNFSGITGEEGALITLTLNAPADFEGSAEVKLTNVKATINNGSQKLDDIVLTVNAKDAVAEQALADMKQTLADAKTEIANNYPAAADDEATATALTEAQNIIDALQAEMLEGNFANVDAKKEALERKVAEAKSQAEAVQAAADAEAAAQTAAATKLSELKTAAEELAVSDEAKAYDNDKVKTSVAAAEEAIEAVNTAIAAVETEIAKGELSTTNKESLATAIAAAEKAIENAKTAIAAAEKTYADQKAAAEEAAASKEANSKLNELKAVAEALAVSEEAEACDDEDVKTDVAAANQAIADANTAVAAVETIIDKGLLATDNKEALAEAIAAAEQAITDAQTAIAAAEEAYAKAPKYIPGDVTGSGDVSDDDMDKFIDDFLHRNYPTDTTSDEFKRYDANGDGKISVADVQAILNLSMGLNADGSDPDEEAAGARAEQLAATMNVKSMVIGHQIRYAVTLNGVQSFTGLQMDVVTNGTRVVELQMANGMQLRSNTQDGVCRILGYGNEIDNSNATLYILVEGEGNISFENVELTDAAARSIVVGNEATAITSVSANTAVGESVYDLSGRKVNALQKGLVIKNGKKVVLKKVL